MSNVPKLIAAMAFLALATNSGAANLNPMPFEQQVAEADLVVLARMSSAARDGSHRLDNAGTMGLTEMQVLRVLKGDANIGSLDFVTRPEIAEHDPNCCQADRTYILLLRRGSNQNIFAAVNGRHSVIAVH